MEQVNRRYDDIAYLCGCYECGISLYQGTRGSHLPKVLKSGIVLIYVRSEDIPRGYCSDCAAKLVFHSV